MILCSHLFYFFFFNDTATPEISPLSLHDALPISTRIRFESCGLWTLIRLPAEKPGSSRNPCCAIGPPWQPDTAQVTVKMRSEEHTSELQSHSDLVCRLLLEKKKTTTCRRAQSKQA